MQGTHASCLQICRIVVPHRRVVSIDLVHLSRVDLTRIISSESWGSGAESLCRKKADFNRTVSIYWPQRWNLGFICLPAVGFRSLT